MKQPLYLLLSHEQASDALRQRNGWTGPFKGHFGGWYYQWERGGRMEGPFVNLATAIKSAKIELSRTYGDFEGRNRVVKNVSQEGKMPVKQFKN